MTDPTLEERVERLESHTRRLERQNTRLRALALVVAAVLVAMVCMGQVAKPKQLEAERFVVRDADGRERAALGANDDGQPVLSLRDADGNRRAELTLDQHQRPGLTLGTPISAERAGGIFLGVDDTYKLEVWGGKGDASATLSADDLGLAGISLIAAGYDRDVSLVLDRQTGIAGLEVRQTWPAAEGQGEKEETLFFGIGEQGSRGVDFYHGGG